MVNEAVFEAKLEEFEEWISAHSFLPEKFEPVVVRRYLHSVYGNLDEAKKLVEHSYTLRSKHPNIFYNRDPLDENIQKIFRVADLGIPLPSLTPQHHRIVLNRLIDHDPEKFDFDNIIKAFFLAADHRFSIKDDHLPLKVNDSDVPIFDMAGLTYRHLARLSLSTLRCYMKFTQEAYPVRLKQIHLINCSPVLSKVLMIIRPFMKARVSKLLTYHSPDSTTLYEHVPQEILPNEYGGSAGSMKDIKNAFVKQLEAQRNYLICEKHWRVRDGNNNSLTNNENLKTSFKSLSID